MELTEPVAWINKAYVGYMVNVKFSAENSQIINTLIQKIRKELGNNVFVMPEDSLHITLLDWVAPLVSYSGKYKTELYASIKEEYDEVLEDIIKPLKPIVVNFKEIRVSPSTIFIVGSDNGEFQKIRDSFVERVELLPGTKRPPMIIHSSLARFTRPIKINKVESFLANQTIDITQIVDNFMLVHSKREPMLDYDVIKHYYLGTKR